MNNNIITIRLSKDAILAYKFLQEKKINPAKYLRDGGEKHVIDTAIKNKFTLKKIKLHFKYGLQKNIIPNGHGCLSVKEI